MNPPKVIIPSTPPICLPSYTPINTPRNENQFYVTLRRYTERLKQQRDISLGYLNRINELEGLLRVKDTEIDHLKLVNRDLNDKLLLYSSVLQRSQVKRPLRMSMILSNNMTESIIQTKPEMEYLESIKPFEQFFVADLSGVKSGLVKFRYTFNANSTEQKVASNLFISNCSPTWQPQPAQFSSTVEKKASFVLFMTNSPLTYKSLTKEKHLDLVLKLNPSCYYYIPCLIHKEALLIGGKLFRVPIIYGFITLWPFPDVYFRLLEEIAGELRVRPEFEPKKLNDSLMQFSKCPADLQVEMRYLFMNKLHTWKIPDMANIDAHALVFSLGVIESFALELIIDVLILLLLEVPITVVSQDELLVCQFMFYFVYIIKPLKYPYPIVFNVNEKLRDLLESPFPTFTGCIDPKDVEPYLTQRAVFDLDNKVAKSWPVLQHLDASREFLMKVVRRVGSYSRFNLVTEEIIKGHQYRELQPYWKDFSKTQIYQNYVHKA